jgi:hypothetical protein
MPDGASLVFGWAVTVLNIEKKKKTIEK